jgi:hypothetical protein
MKQLFLFLSALFISGIVSAQKNFEGTVIYSLHSSSGDKQDAELKVLFGNKKLKLFFKEKDEYEKDALVVLLDSAIIYNINVVEKTFKRSTLTLSSPEQKPQKKSINGYTTTPYQPENTGVGSLLGGMLGSSSVIFYVADSLYYYIPAAFIGNKELLMVQKGKIVLGAEIQIANPYNDPADSNAKSTNIITAEAIDIKPMAINENEFFIPADFVDRKDVPYTETVDSTVAVVVDTVAVAPPPRAKKTVKKKPAKPAPPKSKSTSKAAIRKEQ